MIYLSISCLVLLMAVVACFERIRTLSRLVKNQSSPEYLDTDNFDDNSKYSLEEVTDLFLKDAQHGIDPEVFYQTFYPTHIERRQPLVPNWTLGSKRAKKVRITDSIGDLQQAEKTIPVNKEALSFSLQGDQPLETNPNLP